jgi:predicted DNA-binding protein (UPF0251 family)/predicted Fe-Mo cluster-binding NifX family protein
MDDEKNSINEQMFNIFAQNISMPRPKRQRKLNQPPLTRGFKPYGKNRVNQPELLLHLDEYEAIKLCDYDGLTQFDAAQIMGVSRPTLTRIYAAARKKVAMAIVDGRSFVIEGGVVNFEDRWFRCDDCHAVYTDNNGEIDNECPRCASRKAHELGTQDLKDMRVDAMEFVKAAARFCICPQCGKRVSHNRGKPCKETICPDCRVSMKKEQDISFGSIDKWAVPLLEKSSNAAMNKRFGKSPYFALLSDSKTEFVANPFPADKLQVGLHVLTWLKEQGVKGIVVDFMGKKGKEFASGEGMELVHLSAEQYTLTTVLNYLKEKSYVK